MGGSVLCSTQELPEGSKQVIETVCMAVTWGGPRSSSQWCILCLCMPNTRHQATQSHLAPRHSSVAQRDQHFWCLNIKPATMPTVSIAWSRSLAQQKINNTFMLQSEEHIVCTKIIGNNVGILVHHGHSRKKSTSLGTGA